MKPKLKDVAKKAGVSTATVSKVINKVGGYSKETEENVLRIIKEINYVPNAVARNLSLRSSNIIGVLLPNTETSFAAQLLDGIETTSRENGYSVIICNTGNNGVRALDYIKILSSNQVAGIIYSSSPLFEESFKFVESHNIPCVLALTVSYKFQIPYVKVDDIQASYAATKYLIDKGHREIALIVGNINDPIAGKPRAEGYRQALSDYKIPLDKNHIIFADDFSYESGMSSMRKLIDKKTDITAIFATSDDLAIGAINVAHEMNIRVPEDISIIGYDNTKMAQISFPRLTTLAQPLYEIGKKATEKLITIINGKKVESSTIMNYKIAEESTVADLKIIK